MKPTKIMVAYKYMKSKNPRLYFELPASVFYRDHNDETERTSEGFGRGDYS